MTRYIPSNTRSSRRLPSPKALGASGATSASSGAPGRTGKTARCLDWEQGRAHGLQGCHSATPGLPSSPAWALRNCFPVGQEGRWLTISEGLPLDQHCVTLPCHCPCLSSVCTGWLGKPHLGTNLASRKFRAVVAAQPKSLWLQWVGTVGRGQMSQEGMVECCIL